MNFGLTGFARVSDRGWRPGGCIVQGIGSPDGTFPLEDPLAQYREALREAYRRHKRNLREDPSLPPRGGRSR